MTLKIEGKLAQTDDTHFWFWCPGCKEIHPFTVRPSPRPAWQWDGSWDKPTFNPSLVVAPNSPNVTCHLWVREGKIEYLHDCHHELQGRIVDMVDFKDCPDADFFDGE